MSLCECICSVASGATEESGLGNPTYGEQGINHTIANKMRPTATPKMPGKSSGDYSSDGPEYEPVHTSKPRQRDHNIIWTNKDLQFETRAKTTQTPGVLQPAAYEIPVNSGSQTLPT